MSQRQKRLCIIKAQRLQPFSTISRMRSILTWRKTRDWKLYIHNTATHTSKPSPKPKPILNSKNHSLQSSYILLNTMDPSFSRNNKFPRTSSMRKPHLYFLIAFLCAAFYLLGAYQQRTSFTSLSKKAIVTSPSCTIQVNKPTLDFQSHHNSSDTIAFSSKTFNFPRCGVNFTEYTPCEDPTRSLRYKRSRMIYRERHCPVKGEEDLKCRVPPPHGYKTPFPWPASRDVAWYSNVPHRELTVEKAVQNWIRYDSDRFFFPGGGTMFPNGADAYIDDIGKLINLKDGSIRTALDTGCGVYSLILVLFLVLALIFWCKNSFFYCKNIVNRNICAFN